MSEERKHTVKIEFSITSKEIVVEMKQQVTGREEVITKISMSSENPTSEILSTELARTVAFITAAEEINKEIDTIIKNMKNSFNPRSN